MTKKPKLLTLKDLKLKKSEKKSPPSLPKNSLKSASMTSLKTSWEKLTPKKLPKLANSSIP